jgi:hypothetical protein
MLVLAASSTAAPGQNAPTVSPLPAGNEEDSSPSFSETIVGQSPCAGCCDLDGCQPYCCPRWTASADFIILDRIGTASQTLVERVPYPVPGPVTEALNSGDFQQGFAAGPRLDLIRHCDSGYDLEFSYFQIDGWSSDRSVGPDDPPDWLVMTSPGFTQTNQKPDQAMVWDYATRLYNAELNVRWDPCSRVTMLAGFRWVRLGENLVAVHGVKP